MQRESMEKILPIFYIIVFILIGMFIYNIMNNNNSEEIIINDTEIELEYGSMEKIDATLETKKDSEGKIIYTSSEPNLVTVDKDGYIHANSNADGKATITVKSEETGISKDVIVKVNKVESIVEVNSIEVDKEVINLVYQQTDKINARVIPENATNKGITWESDNPKLVTVDNGGNVKAVANEDGQAILTVKTKEGNFTKKVKVNVTYVKQNKKVTGINLNKSKITLKYNENTKLVATVLPNDATNKEVTWSSSNPSLVSVDQDGNIKVVSNKSGEAVITVKTKDGSHSSSVKVIVRKVDKTVKVTGVKIDGTNNGTIYLNKNQSIKLSANVQPSNATNKTVTWSSSNPSLVSVDQDGNIKVVSNKSGEAVVTVKTKDGGHSSSVKVIVKKVNKTVKVTGIKIDGANNGTIYLNKNQSIKLSANVQPLNATNKTVTWSSSNPSLVSVDQDGNIKVLSNKSGEAVVTVKTKDGGHSSSVKVIVKKVDKTIKVTGIKIDGANNGTIYLNKNQSIKLSANVQPSNATNKAVTWSSSDNSVATVDNNGNVTANKIGSVNITVTTNDGKYTDTYNLIIKQKVIVVITASAGVRMNNWFKNYISVNQNSYNVSSNSLNYIYKSGAGFEFQYGEGLEKAKSHINSVYSNNKNYIDLSIFFTLTGNSVKNLTCDGIKTSGEYSDIANKYNNAVQQFINLGYKNTKGYVISHSPLNTKYAIKNFPTQSSKAKIVYSHKEEACQKGYRSAYKYWLSNQRMKNILNSGNYGNLKFIDNYSNFVVINNEANRTFTWLKNNNGITYDNLYKTTDGLHWDEATTKIYMQLAFDTASM